MAADTAVSASPEETLESLLREAEALKQKLEEERQKLNDVTCKYLNFLCILQISLFYCFLFSSLLLHILWLKCETWPFYVIMYFFHITFE